MEIENLDMLEAGFYSLFSKDYPDICTAQPEIYFENLIFKGEIKITTLVDSKEAQNCEWVFSNWDFTEATFRTHSDEFLLFDIEMANKVTLSEF